MLISSAHPDVETYENIPNPVKVVTTGNIFEDKRYGIVKATSNAGFQSELG